MWFLLRAGIVIAAIACLTAPPSGRPEPAWVEAARRAGGPGASIAEAERLWSGLDPAARRAILERVRAEAAAAIARHSPNGGAAPISAR